MTVAEITVKLLDPSVSTESSRTSSLGSDDEIIIMNPTAYTLQEDRGAETSSDSDQEPD